MGKIAIAIATARHSSIGVLSCQFAMPAYAGADPRHPYHDLLADEDVFAQDHQDQVAAMAALVDSLAPPTDLAALQSFLASDAAQNEKIEQLVNFLADDAPPRDELLADTDVFADEHEQQKQDIAELVDSLANGTANGTAMATALLATNTDEVASVNEQTSFLSVLGGAVVLLVAVVLAVVTKRARTKRQEEDERQDFGYSILYE
jgi:hypothetical protein